MALVGDGVLDVPSPTKWAEMGSFSLFLLAQEKGEKKAHKGKDTKKSFPLEPHPRDHGGAFLCYPAVLGACRMVPATFDALRAPAAVVVRAFE